MERRTQQKRVSILGYQVLALAAWKLAALLLALLAFLFLVLLPFFLQWQDLGHP